MRTFSGDPMNDPHRGKALVALVLCCLATSAAAACGSSSGSGGSDAGSSDVTTDHAPPRDGPLADSADVASSDGAADADATGADAPGADTGPGDTGQPEGSAMESGSGDADASDAIGDAEAGPSEDAPFDGEAGPASLCPGSTFLFCDGFEQNLTNWTSIDSTGGAVSVDSAHVYRGAKAMHASINAIADAGASANAMVQKFGSQPWPTHFFTRFFAYVPSPDPPSTAGLLDLIQNGAPYSGTEPTRASSRGNRRRRPPRSTSGSASRSKWTPSPRRSTST
jgi:hypothetical protein